MAAHDDHRDAHLLSLRLALGSIMAPKRTSYTRSPADSSGTATPAPPHASPSSSPASFSPTHLQNNIHAHGLSGSTTTAPTSQLFTEPPVVPPAVASTAAPVPRANFIGTLQSKSAWDALIHGAWA
ncbi:hypothetical protein WOLCODRAFT_138139 [Wolfiporia cocos MD-104 SS10]|uniref:Uncharacterized protein n=1 Tax=Wolfiporia cocos (strain MD-104) TaxID=742152 RepID=A0A2H3JM68_WOLCO|nr:hypothetical protein WOLCODRAFT_138139 [Wolfiporia cocos MD-104 SS10]